ncbi:DUF418 domain-containing protein [Nonomuraea angiospora]|uniref:DUF418 domain-containing protein n=1 Tax=Nonomuraea angiospora TaxID=46172 RepID=A0ABR9M1T5_9ACTN|nr:DUF418 domain-containing protein [Nonomuraea angiospora]MBE1586862.1 uncharacterized protein [Nonomuraea angiospora]MDX3107286.1 DUF418 domain-containing protein [Nonomuraea angiospora]
MDALRGFALLGILVVNIAFLASGYRMAGMAEPAFQSPVDWTVRFTVTLLVENKFYLLFSFLFGYSFTLQVDSAARQGRPFGPMFLRRLAGLLLIGLAHAVLLFPGDILTTYAAVGLALLIFRKLRPKAAVVLAVMLTAMLALGFVLLALLATFGLDMGGTVADSAAEATKADTALAASAVQIISEHLRKLSLIIVFRVLFQGPAVLAACLIGLAVGKLGALRDLSAHTGTLRKLQWAGFTVGLAGAFVYTTSAWHGTMHKFWGEAVDLVTAPLLAAAYAATFLRLLPYMPRIARALAAPGRMALSNYLAQSLICSLIFTGYGLALVDRVSPPLEVLIALGVFVCQVFYSHWWLKRHRYGPVEWILRFLTYWRKPSPSRPRHSVEK